MPITRCCNNNEIGGKSMKKKFYFKNTERRSILDTLGVKKNDNS
jgi:hypothetical protein